MNDSSWGAPPQAGYWGPTDQGLGHGPAQGHGQGPVHGHGHGPVQGQGHGHVRGAAPAGPAYDAREAPHTRPMPIVPDVAAHGGNQDDDRGAASPS
ncbi:hypothetical protein ACFVON_29515, partial [Streptomyces sp. NPDC057794]